MSPLKGEPQPKGWHPQKATKHWLSYKKYADELATRTLAERERRDREEKARTEWYKHQQQQGQKGG